MRASLVLALVAVACPALGTATAGADVVFAAHDAPLELGPATIEVDVTRFEARFTVRYEVANPGPLPDEAMVELATPPASAVTGLRYQPRAGAAWLDARLLAAGDAFARWERYADAHFVARRGPALIELQAGSVPVLRLLFVPARDRVAVEYTIVAPVCRAGGHWIAPAPPAPSSDDDDARYVVRGPRGAGRRVGRAEAPKLIAADVADACSASDPQAAWDAEDFVVVRAPDIPASHGVASRMVLVPAGNQRFVDVVIDTGTRLSPAPRDASVVFVIDASISMGEGGVAAQLGMVRAYLARAPGARFELVVYRRHATRVFGRWRAGADVEAALAEAGVAPFAIANGSSLDAGLASAATILARAPGPRRIVAFTDDRVREALDEELARSSLADLPADAVLHVVSTSAHRGRASALDRADDHFLAGVAARWGGIAAGATLGADGELPHARADVFEELVRPRRIDDVVIAHGHGERAELGAILEGQSVRALERADSDAVTVQGMIWGRPWQPTLVTSDRARRNAAALVVADEQVWHLERDVVRSLATMAHAVSTETSLWADDPRWTPGGLPPEVALDGRATPCGIIGSIGGGSFSTTSSHVGVGRFGPARERPDVAALLAGPVAACASRSGLVTWSVGLELETTGREIVDVRLARGADDPAFAHCVVESAWSLALGEAFDAWTASFAVDVLGDSARR